MSLRKLASLSFALALVYSISLPARAELIKNFKTDGSIELKSFGIENESDRDGTADDHRGETRSRILLGGSFDLLDDVHSRILLRKNNHVQGQATESVQNVENTVAVDNAYVKIDKLFNHVDLTIGRQFYGSSSDLLIYFGLQPDDVLSVTSLDIFRADADIMGIAKFQGIGGKLTESTVANTATPTPPGAANSNGDVDLYGGELTFDKIIPKGSLGAGFYTQKTKGVGTATANNTLNNWTLKLMGDLPVLTGLGYNAQYVQNSGRNHAAAGAPGYNGLAYILGLTANHDMGKMPLRAHAEYGRGTSGFTAIAPGKRFGKIWGEHTNVATAPSMAGPGNGAGLSDLRVIDFGAGTQCPITHLGFDLNWYKFAYDAPTNAGTAAAGTTPGKRNAGSELDFIVSHKHSENVSLEASLARFWIGDALENAAAPTSPVTRYGVDVKIKF